jgi:hypothetical protein
VTFNTPVSSQYYQPLAILLVSVACVLTAWFMIYQVTTARFDRSLLKELGIAAVGSVFWGSGLLFSMLASGLYV